MNVLKNVGAISQMEMKYQFAEHQKKLAEQQLAISNKDNKIKTQRLWIVGSLAGSLLIILSGLHLRRQAFHKQRIAALKMQQEKEMLLLQAMIEGEEKERKRLAHELHDGLGGLLGTIRMQLGTTLESQNQNTESGEYRDILELLEGAYDELRKTAHNLMPETLQQEGLGFATRIFCDRVRRANTLEIHYETVGEIPRLRPILELGLYRIIQELVHNIVKHAKASEALVQLAINGDCLIITVEDNGIGIQETPYKSEKTGIGLSSIQERITKMGGKFDILSAVNRGTSINIELYLTENTRFI
jgi:signal transduction histidine kinase